jgi:DNA polymerase-3 subunit gamma/tau
MEPSIDINLARKWRPKTFDTVIGQDIPIKMLKNSLYMNKFFPVYLFAGQRGCGKTTTARIFAAAVNCQNLATFQKNPTGQQLPCLTCPSCQSMIQGEHPDFIEIDAASHTGVDNVRAIIEASCYLPQQGQKKVYLIDEAHMLSKAAFNAFLKVLEEPPATVLFLLATTELNKIPTTVLSRCFQLMFTHLPSVALKEHLQAMCLQEGVTIEPDAIDIIIQETDGSGRDAINMLERVRFSTSVITQETVLSVLGKISSEQLLTLFEYVVTSQPGNLLAFLQQINIQSLAPQMIWDMVIDLCRTLVLVKYNIMPTSLTWTRKQAELKQMADLCSLSRLQAIFQFLWHQEELFLKTSQKHIFFEQTLVLLCEQAQAPEHVVPQNIQQPVRTASPTAPQPIKSVAPEQQIAPAPQPPPQTIQTNSNWGTFIQKISTKTDDALLMSIFKQATFEEINEQKTSITISLPTPSKFFNDKLVESKSLWIAAAQEVWESAITDITLIKRAGTTPPPPVISPPSMPKPTFSSPQQQKPVGQAPSFGHAKPYQKTASYGPAAPTQTFLTIKDPGEWPTSSLLLGHFSGKIRKMDQ